jgi:acetyltransferase-like isoleucine patch superfamily enzyme
MLTHALRRRLAECRGVNPAVLSEWPWRDLLAFIALAAGRFVRGLWVKLRVSRAEGLVLCERGVRLYHARHIRAGGRLNLEEGCEIVGLAKRGVTFGNRCTVGRHAVVRPSNVLLGVPGEGLRMGDDSNIGSFNYIGCSGFIEIGNRVMMGPRVTMIAEEHVVDRTDVPMKDQGVRRAPIRVENDCWLGAGSTILAGVTVGHGSVVAAGAVVTRDVPPLSVVAGVPARVIRGRQDAASAT